MNIHKGFSGQADFHRPHEQFTCEINQILSINQNIQINRNYYRIHSLNKKIIVEEYYNKNQLPAKKIN